MIDLLAFDRPVGPPGVLSADALGRRPVDAPRAQLPRIGGFRESSRPVVSNALAIPSGCEKRAGSQLTSL